MNNFIYENATKVYFGKGCIQEYLQCLIQAYGNHVMIVYGEKSFKENGLYGKIIPLLKEIGLDILEFGNIKKNFTYATMLEGARLAKRHHIDFILGIGGGSVIDCCKAIALDSNYKGDVWNDFWQHPGIFKEEPIPVGVIVTTFGSGSECNGKAMLYHEGLHIKVGRDYPQCNPKFALLDPYYTFDNSIHQIMSGDFYSLCHMMESYFSDDENNAVDSMIAGAMESLIKALYQTLENPEDYNIRSNLMWLSSISENRLFKLGKRIEFECQEIVHQLSLYTHRRDGELFAAIYPTYCQKIYEKVPHKFERFGMEILKLSHEGMSQNKFILNTIQALIQMINDFGLSFRLKDLEIDNEELLKQISRNWHQLPVCLKKMDEEEIYKLLKACF